MIKHVLLIEDDEIILDNLKEFLILNEFKVTATSDGNIAVQLIQTDEKFDIIVCDVMLPGLSGMEIYKAIKEKVLNNQIPFIFLSAKSEMSDIRLGMDLGADDYLTKPFLMSELLTVINLRLHKQEMVNNRLIEDVKTKFDEFPKVLNHELNTPINGILGLSTLIHENYQTLTREEFRYSAKLIIESCNRLQKTQKKIFNFFELLNYSADQKSHKIQLLTVIHNIDLFINSFKQQYDDLDLIKYSNPMVSLANHFETEMEATHLQTILDELLENSLKYSVKSTQINLNTIFDKHNNTLEISISNQIDQSKAEDFNLYKNFLSEKRSLTGYQGFGLGLLFIQKICSINNIDFNFSSAEKLITFYVKLKFEKT